MNVNEVVPVVSSVLAMSTPLTSGYGMSQNTSNVIDGCKSRMQIVMTTPVQIVAECNLALQRFADI